jgi:hypothetical protein
VREKRLKFFEEYDRSVPKDFFGFAQMATEAITDEEYLRAMSRKMRIKTALIGVESFSQEGLKSAGKERTPLFLVWNPIRFARSRQ